MPIHRVKNHRGSKLTNLHAVNDAERFIPKFHMPEKGIPPQAAYDLIHDELLLDGNSRQNLATFCTTWVDTEVRKLMDENIDKNMIDKDEYPQTAEIESRCVHILADLWHAPTAAETAGCSTTGSSEAAMLGGLSLKWQWRKKRAAQGKPTDKPNIVCGPVQVCWHKFARYFDVELREIPLAPGAICTTADQLAPYCDENTIGVVATLGVTFTCVYEPVKEFAKALDALQKETGLDIPIHVDAASGGFVAPFLHKDVEWDFRIPRVKSINTSGHKYGLSPLGVGWVIWREMADLAQDLIFWVDYLGGNMPTFALNFSRPGGEIIAQYYNFLRLGHDGYTRIHETCAQTAQYLAAELSKFEHIEMLYDGNGGLPAVCYKLKDPKRAGFTMYDLSERVRMRGWQIASYPLPANRHETVVQRILVRHGVTGDMASLLLEDISRALDHLQKNPLAQSTARPMHSHAGR
ncbi:MAG TPA: glutamate decarboxylase [Rhizomicrobium sp.]|jgi:glutamate decarboxylase|nr:glutamate decarboxylase [Rhizomicrobium sp.]